MLLCLLKPYGTDEKRALANSKGLLIFYPDS